MNCFCFENSMSFFEKVTYLCRKVNFTLKHLLFPLHFDLKTLKIESVSEIDPNLDLIRT